MSEKMTCPGCGTHTSSVRFAYIQDEPCPECGLSADATSQISMIQRRRADEALTAQLTEALKRIDTLQRENDPAAVLRRCAADREIVEWYSVISNSAVSDGTKVALTKVIKLLARGYGVQP